MARFQYLHPSYDADCTVDTATVEDVHEMQVFRSGALGFLKNNRLVKAVAPGEWFDAWEVTEQEAAQP